MVDHASAGDLGVEPGRALTRFVLTLADSKRLLGIRYSDWLLGSPSIETGIALSSMAQDEWGHARLLYALLKDLGLDPALVEHGRPAVEYASVDTLDELLPDWAAVVAAMVVVDGALTALLEGFANGRYEPARGRVPKMLLEEEFHRDLGLAWFGRLAGSGSAEGRERLTHWLGGALPRLLAWLDPEDDASGALAEAGLVGSGARERFRLRAGPILEAAGVDLARVAPERSGWDAGRARGPGHPDPEAVERARGDRNRALLVE